MRPRTTAARRLVAVIAVLILSGVAIAHHEHRNALWLDTAFTLQQKLLAPDAAEGD